MTSHEIVYCDVLDEINDITFALSRIEETVKSCNRKLNMLTEVNSNLSIYNDTVCRELLEHRKTLYEMKVNIAARLAALEKKMSGKLKNKLEKSCMPILGCIFRGS